MTSLPRISAAQARLMAKLDDGFDHIDSVGVPRSDLSDHKDVELLGLIIEELAKLHHGYGGLAWARLTEKGRKVREEGRG